MATDEGRFRFGLMYLLARWIVSNDKNASVFSSHLK